MKKLLFALIFSAAIFVPAISAHAQFDPFQDACREAGANASDSSVCQQDGRRDPITGTNGIILTVVRLLSFLVGVVSVIMVIYGGLKYITANGDANSIQSARNTIMYALIGVALFAFSQAIVAFIINRLWE